MQQVQWPLVDSQKPMDTGIRYPNEDRARMKGRYGTGGGKIRILWRHWLKLLVENSQTAKEMPIPIMRILAGVHFVPCTGLWRTGKIQKLELYSSTHAKTFTGNVECPAGTTA